MCALQVLVQSHLVLDTDHRAPIGDDPPFIDYDPQAASAYPVPQSSRLAVNLTVITTDAAVALVNCSP